MSCLIYLYRRADREPSAHSRICSCHFRDGKSALVQKYMPEMLKKFSHPPAVKAKQSDQSNVMKLLLKKLHRNKEKMPQSQVQMKRPFQSSRPSSKLNLIAQGKP